LSNSQRPGWIDAARKELLRLGEPGPGWGYRRGGMDAVEPTALACLALQATDYLGSDLKVANPVLNAARWLASIQQPNGAVGISQTLTTPEWATPFAILVWANQSGYGEEVEKGTNWLLQHQGLTYSQDEGRGVGHDPSIPGWAWVSETHSWLEPTALSILALRRRGLGNHARVRDGLRLIRDRALAHGGWNIGNSSIYGTDLRPQPGLTGIALLALSGTQTADDLVDKACAYLQRALPGVRSAQSLGWGILSLTAWGRRPAEAEQWLAEAFAPSVLKPDSGPLLAYLLLASSQRSLSLLGAEAPK
jgi:hypothetical protein